MRIIAGEFRGRRLHGPRVGGLRPTSDRVREAVFSKIAGRVAGAEVLDLFAGTGALGLEALSRGAKRVLFVDRGAEALRLLQANIARCGVEQRCRVMRAAIPAGLHRLLKMNQRYDLIFMDPPYSGDLVAPALTALRDLAEPGALVVVEHRVNDQFEVKGPEWLPEDARTYGDTAISFLVRAQQ